MPTYTKEQLREMIKEAAEQRGLGWLYDVTFKGMPLLEYIVTRESSWDPTIQSGYIRPTGEREPSFGLFQCFTKDAAGNTGLGYGYTPEQLRDPATNIRIALDHIAQSWATSGSLAETFRDWDNEQYDPGFHAFLLGQGQSAASQVAGPVYTGPYQPPDPSSPKYYEMVEVETGEIDPATGKLKLGLDGLPLTELMPDPTQFKHSAYQDDLNSYLEMSGGGQDPSQVYIDYLDTVLDTINADISQRNLSVSEASQRFNDVANVWQDAYSAYVNLAPYTIPKGVEYIPGFEPGRSHIGPVKATPITINPFQKAMELIQGMPAPVGGGLTEELLYGEDFRKGLDYLKGLALGVGEEVAPARSASIQSPVGNPEIETSARLAASTALAESGYGMGQTLVNKAYNLANMFLAQQTAARVAQGLDPWTGEPIPEQPSLLSQLDQWGPHLQWRDVGEAEAAVARPVYNLASGAVSRGLDVGQDITGLGEYGARTLAQKLAEMFRRPSLPSVPW